MCRVVVVCFDIVFRHKVAPKFRAVCERERETMVSYVQTALHVVLVTIETTHRHRSVRCSCAKVNMKTNSL